MKKYWLLIAFMIGLSSCSDMLQEKPKSVLNPDQFFNSDAEAIAGVNGAYTHLYWFYGSATTNDLGYWSYLGTDLARPTGGRETTFNYHTYTLSSADEGAIADIWRRLFRAIGDCNLVISRVTDNPAISEPVRTRVLGEALFLRAQYYYILTCYWGDAPMWLGPLDLEESGGAIARTPVSEIRQQAISDLKQAEVNLPSAYAGADLGRASKWAAKMLMCKYYLWEKEYENAKATAGEIIEQEDGPHHLLAEYADIWGEANEYNAELIWEIDFTQDVHATALTSRFMPRQIDEPSIPGYTMSGYGLVTSTEEFLSTFHPDDVREPWYDWHGDGTITTNFHYVAKNMNWSAPRANSGSNSIVYRLADAYLMYAEAENELNGPTTDAYQKINTIRARAQVPDLSGLTQDQFRQAIMDERKWELGFEFHRRWDLARWGKLVEAVQSNAVSNPAGAANVRSYHQLLPIPSRELSLNPALAPNNPGY